MIEFPPDVEDSLREKAAHSGQAVGDYLRLILDRQDGTSSEVGSSKSEDYPREGAAWTEEEMRRELEWAMCQRPPA